MFMRSKLTTLPGCQLLTRKDNTEDVLIQNIFCCDLPSHALAHLPPQALWVTILPSLNIIAVAAGRGCQCVVFAGGARVPQAVLAAAQQYGIAVYTTNLQSYEFTRQLESL